MRQNEVKCGVKIDDEIIEVERWKMTINSFGVHKNTQVCTNTDTKTDA